MRQDRPSNHRRRGSVIALALAVSLAAPLLAVPGLSGTAGAAPRVAQANPPARTGTIPTLPKSSAFVSRLYSDFLGRPAPESDVAYWGSQIDSSGSVDSTVRSVLTSNEYLGTEVQAAYSFLGTQPTQAQLASWTTKLREGQATWESLAASLIATSQFAAHWSTRGASQGQDIARGMFEVLTGSEADTAGRAIWAARLDGTANRAPIVLAFERTAVVADRSVANAYQIAVGRLPSPSEAAQWRAQFASGASGHDALVRLLLDSPERLHYGCDPLGGTTCLLPFPDDYLTVDDPGTLTGKRLALSNFTLPTNNGGTPVNPQPTNRSDGFSPGGAATLLVPGIDLAKTGAVPVTDIARYADANAPIAVIDAATGQRQPIWAEMDSTAPVGQQVLYIRPAKDWLAGHRYIVVLRNLKNSSGATIPAPATFAAYRDGGSVNVGGFEARRPHMEDLFRSLGTAGFARSSLYLDWDFTVASTANVTGRLLHIRDDAFARLGNAAPSFQVTNVTDNPRTGVAREVQGTYQVPSYLTKDTPGGTFVEGADGQPQYAGHDLTTTFTCMVPTSSLTTPARGIVYGHGLFGDQTEVEGQDMIVGDNMVYCATDWLGMAESDLGSAFAILSDVSLFPELADRVQEGVVATLFLGQLLKDPRGFASDPAFQNPTHHPVIVTGDVFYDGNSQGGILGGLTTAVSTVWTRAVLGVTGIDFSLLVQRSVDFAPFFSILSASYPDPITRAIGLDLMQVQWDRAEPDGYAAHLVNDPLPGTPAHKVEMDVAVGDHQVATVAADLEARTAGIPAHIPAVGPGRSTDVTPLWGITRIPSYPVDGSSYFYWDSGSPLAPTTNTPPSAGHDPHEDPRHAALTSAQKNAFLQTNGTVIDPCAGQPCVIPQD